MTRYPVKKGKKILTKKRGMVTNYVTEDDFGSKAMVKDLLQSGFISDPENKEKKEFSKGKK